MFDAPRNNTAFASYSKKKDVTFITQNSLLITGLLIPILEQQTVLDNKKLLSFFLMCPAVSVCFTGGTSFSFDENDMVEHSALDIVQVAIKITRHT